MHGRIRRDFLHATVATLLSALASGPEVAWAVLVEVQAAGRNGLALRRDVLDRYVTLLCETAGDMAVRFPDEVRPVGEELVLAAVGGIHELMLARVERGQADSLECCTAQRFSSAPAGPLKTTTSPRSGFEKR